jgi:hypothetical protein
MNARMSVMLVALIATPFVALAADPPDAAGDQSKLSCIKDMVFSQEFLARYPRAGAACREVVMKNGMKWARFDADVVDVKGNQVTANFLDTFNQPLSTVTFVATPEARVLVEGKEAKFSSLNKGDTLSFWMPESRVGFYAAPGASEAKKLAVVDTKTSRQ